ncbi:MAG TPA: alpha/beta fold hydrolase [Micromonosporaceae bacterium]
MDQQATVTAVPTRLGPLRVQTLGDGPPAMLWHSLFVDSTTWIRVRQPLAGARRLLLIDAPGHGGNPPVSRPYTLADCADAATDILDHFGIDGPVDWLGNALGGHVGIVFAAMHPRRCRTLAAIGAPVHALSPVERRRIKLLLAMYRMVGPGAVANILVDALLGPNARTGDPDGAAIVANAFRRASRRGMTQAIRSVSLDRPDLTDQLSRITAPTLLTTGHDDPMWTTSNARNAASHLANGALVFLPAAGHIGPLLQAAPDVVDLIMAFWRAPDTTVAGRRGATASPRTLP